jgi:hypothetical protein
MNTASLGAAVNLLASVAECAQVVSSLIQEAASAGRTTLSDEEWASITAAADKAHQGLKTVLGTTAVDAPAPPAA